MDDLITRYVERALEARANGRTIDLEQICADHPELIPAVRKLLRLDDALDPGTVDREPTDDNQPDPLPDPLSGSVLHDRYELHGCIGIGAMGAVYRATDRTLRRDVAAKLLQNGLFASPERHERFMREARVLASLRHPHIVEIYDHGRSAEGLHYIVMERLVGVPLSQILQQAELDAGAGIAKLDNAWLNRQFDLELTGLSYIPQVVFWCRQVAAALQAAHAASITHRDVKPTNIFVDEQGQAILLDFGIAAKAGDGSLTAQGSTVGSPWYMAPEQVGSRGVTTELVDVYGLCATLYHLVTLRPPYDGDYAEVLRQLAATDPTPPNRIRPELSRDLCAVIEKGMERDPHRRYASMKELGSDLQALCEQLPVQARTISRAARWLRSVRRRPAPAVAAAVLLLGIGITIPIVSHYQQRVQAQESARGQQYRDRIAALAPSMAFEGTPENRPQLDAAERAGYLDQLEAVLSLQPDDLFVRLLHSALLLDQGDLQDSLADIRWIAERHDSPFQRAFLTRYETIDTGQPGVLGLDLNALPEPQTEVDRVVLGFQLYRFKEWEDAHEILTPATSPHARNIRLGLLKILGKRLFRNARDRSLLTELLVESELLEQEQGCATARNLYYRGSALLDLRDYGAAEPVLELSRRLCPQAYGTNFNLGMARMELGQAQEALDVILVAKRLRPDNINAVPLVARLLAELGDFDAAMAAIEDMQRSGYLVEPWHRSFYSGLVEALRAIDLFGQSQLEEATAAENRSLDHYETALAQVAPGSGDHNTITSNMAFLVLHETEPTQRVGKLLALIESNPNSHLHLAALATAVEKAETLIAPEGLRQQLAALLTRQARALEQQTNSKPK